jgi:hypothetical protein
VFAVYVQVAVVIDPVAPSGDDLAPSGGDRGLRSMATKTCSSPGNPRSRGQLGDHEFAFAVGR